MMSPETPTPHNPEEYYDELRIVLTERGQEILPEIFGSHELTDQQDKAVHKLWRDGQGLPWSKAVEKVTNSPYYGPQVTLDDKNEAYLELVGDILDGDVDTGDTKQQQKNQINKILDRLGKTTKLAIPKAALQGSELGVSVDQGEELNSILFTRIKKLENTKHNLYK